MGTSKSLIIYWIKMSSYPHLPWCDIKYFILKVELFHPWVREETCTKNEVDLVVYFLSIRYFGIRRTVSDKQWNPSSKDWKGFNYSFLYQIMQSSFKNCGHYNIKRACFNRIFGTRVGGYCQLPLLRCPWQLANEQIKITFISSKSFVLLDMCICVCT